MPDLLIERRDIAEQRERSMNGPLTMIPGQDNFGVKATPIYFYNVSQLDFNIGRPPNHPHMYIKPCPKGEPFTMARGSITHPFTELREDQNENKYPVLTDGYKEATKMMNPLNPGTDQNFNVKSDLSVGDNLNVYGVFWSVHSPPLKEEVEAANARLETTYREELERMSRAKTADEAMQMANRISHAAADYFGFSGTWHQTNLASRDYGKVECTACGEKIAPAAKICKECGAPTNAVLQEKWLADRFEKRGPGRPPNS